MARPEDAIQWPTADTLKRIERKRRQVDRLLNAIVTRKVDYLKEQLTAAMGIPKGYLWPLSGDADDDNVQISIGDKGKRTQVSLGRGNTQISVNGELTIDITDKDKTQGPGISCVVSKNKVIVNGREVPMPKGMTGRSSVIKNGKLIVDGYRYDPETNSFRK
jgi:hypothetical protein